jgi:hypothetical protein
MTEREQQALGVEIEAEFGRIEALAGLHRLAIRSARSDVADVTKAKLIEDFIALQGRVELLPETERRVAQRKLSALELQLP